MIERAWANVWAFIVWRPRDWFYAREFTYADAVLSAIVIFFLFLLIGVAIFHDSNS